MRGKIIHYNGADGRGLVAAGERQFPFEIARWRSDTAPAVNQVVEVVLSGETVASLSRVAEDVLLKEKAGQLASRLSSAGGAALQSLKESAPGVGTAGPGWLGALGKSLLIAQGAFALSALALPYVSVNPMGVGGRSFTLAGLSEISGQMGASVGGAFWTWLAIASIALPVFWKSRWAWLALLLPLLATLKPILDMGSAVRKASEALGGMGSRIADQVLDMIEPGLGFWICLLAALSIAGIGLKRVLLPPSA